MQCSTPEAGEEEKEKEEKEAENFRLDSPSTKRNKHTHLCLVRLHARNKTILLIHVA